MALTWKTPPIIKLYEALGALGDGRIEIDGNTAKVYSSSRGKFYTVTYDPETSAIMCNDNGSYWQGYLGYPAITFLCAQGTISYQETWAKALSGIAWKDVNTKFKNDFDKTETYVLEKVAEQGLNTEELKKDLAVMLQSIEALHLVHLGPKTKPPTGY